MELAEQGLVSKFATVRAFDAEASSQAQGAATCVYRFKGAFGQRR